MLRNKNHLQTVFLSTTTLALVSMGMPDKAQAQQYPTILPTDRYNADFRNALLGKTNTSTVPNKGRFVDAIQSFKVLDSFTTINPVKNSFRGYLVLETMQVPNSNFFTGSNFSNISGPIYEYRFFVTSYPNILLDPNFVFPYDSSGFTKWYVPSNATYTSGTTSFSYALGTGTSPDPNLNLLTSLGGLNTILGLGRAAGLLSLNFPSNIILKSGERANVIIDTVPTPEPNTAISLTILGMAGSLVLLKRKISQS